MTAKTANKDYSIVVGGQAGQGSRKTGLIIAKLFSQLGYNIFIYDDYQSLIRGGHSFSKIRVSTEEVVSHRKGIDFLLALDDNTVNTHQEELSKEGIIIYDTNEITLLNQNAIGIDLNAAIKELEALPIIIVKMFQRVSAR